MVRRLRVPVFPAFRYRLAGALAAAMLVTAACRPDGTPGQALRPPPPPPPPIEIALGATYQEVVAALGPPLRGPLFDRYSNTREITYTYPVAVILAERRLSKNETRTEPVDRIHMFFDSGNRLVRMASVTDPYYSWFSSALVNKITIPVPSPPKVQ